MARAQSRLCALLLAAGALCVTITAPVPHAHAPGFHLATSLSTSPLVLTAAATCVERAVLPAYFNPGRQWDAALAAATSGSPIIVNPNSGPGSGVDASYTALVAKARAKGATLFGYIDTGFTHVRLSQIQTEVGDYRAWYGIDDVFFDDVATNAGDVAYYQSADKLVRATDPAVTIMLNPGTYPSARYASLGDIMVVFENTYQRLLTTKPPRWIGRHPSAMFAMLVSGVPGADVDTAVARVAADHARYIYTSPQTVSTDLYGALPNYWRTELTAIRHQQCRGTSGAIRPR